MGLEPKNYIVTTQTLIVGLIPLFFYCFACIYMYIFMYHVFKTKVFPHSHQNRNLIYLYKYLKVKCLSQKLTK